MCGVSARPMGLAVLVFRPPQRASHVMPRPRFRGCYNRKSWLGRCCFSQPDGRCGTFFMRTSKNDDLRLDVVISWLGVSTSELVRAVVVRATASIHGVSLNNGWTTPLCSAFFFSAKVVSSFRPLLPSHWHLAYKSSIRRHGRVSCRLKWCPARPPAAGNRCISMSLTERVFWGIGHKQACSRN